MIVALLLGRKGSVGFPEKNLYPVINKPLAFYPMRAALKARSVDKVYISTDDEELMELARKNGVEVIMRPPELCTEEALGEDAFVHGYFEIKKNECRKRYIVNSAPILQRSNSHFRFNR